MSEPGKCWSSLDSWGRPMLLEESGFMVVWWGYTGHIFEEIWLMLPIHTNGISEYPIEPPYVNCGSAWAPAIRLPRNWLLL